MYNRCSSTIKGGIKLLWKSVLSKGSKILDLGGILKNIFTYLLSTLPYIYSISLKYSLISWLKCNCIRPLSQARNYTRNFDALDVDLGNRWITAASTKETKEFPRDELISTYSYRHGCPRYSLVTHGWHYRFLFLFFLSLSLLSNFSSITVSSAHLFPYHESTTGPPPGWHERVFQPFQPCNVRTSNDRYTPHVRRNRVCWNIYRRGTFYRWICHAGNDNVVYRVVWRTGVRKFHLFWSLRFELISLRNENNN